MINFNALSDEELMQCLKDGHDEAMQAIYERHSDRAWSFIKQRAPQDLKEDIFQDCFLKLSEKRESWNGQPFILWFYVLIRNVINDSYRRKRITQKYSEASGDQDNQINEDEFTEMISVLSEENAKLLREYFSEGRSHKDLSNMYNLSEVTLRKRLSRALKMLKKELLR